jgi:hypothetical protein
MRKKANQLARHGANYHSKLNINFIKFNIQCRILQQDSRLLSTLGTFLSEPDHTTTD